MGLCLIYIQILGFLFFLPPSSSQQCSDKCWFVYDPSDNRSSYEDHVTIDVPQGRKISGIITIDAQFREIVGNRRGVIRDTLRFSMTEDSGEYPLVLAIDVMYSKRTNQLVVWGEATFPSPREDNKHGVQFLDRPPFKFKIFPNTTINIQLSDMNITTDRSYQLYTGKPGNGEKWQYNYQSDEIWQQFKNIRLNATTKIVDVDPHNLTRYNFISVCDDPRPVLCDAEPDEIVNAVLGAEYALSCSGSGAPYLSSKWDKETYKPTFETRKEVIVNTTADNFIRSTMKIDSFTVNHIGTWTCTIFNLNLQGVVKKTYLLHYNETASIMDRPSLETYDPSTGNTTLVWKIEGWPLDQIDLECNIETVRSHDIRRDTKQFYNKAPPRLTMTLVLTTAVTQGMIRCRLLNEDEVMDNMTITKVGYNCKSGQYGKGRFCLDCPRGETSSPGRSTYCTPVNNSCSQNMFGVGKDCRICPWGTVTFINDTAAKEQDCRNVSSSSHCSPGEYGYGVANNCQCRSCPRTQTSLRGAVKSYDCTYVKSFCGKPGYWGEKGSCKPCRGNHTSENDAVKIQDCYPVKSPCNPGYFGIDTPCTVCPEGMTSHSQTFVREGCFKNSKYTGTQEKFPLNMIIILLIIIVGLMFGLICVAAKGHARYSIGSSRSADPSYAPIGNGMHSNGQHSDAAPPYDSLHPSVIVSKI